MGKTRTHFICQNCGFTSPQWLGKCTSCGEWNTFVEEIVQKNKPVPFKKSQSDGPTKATLIQDVEFRKDQKSVLKDKELERVLGGGLVAGSLILFGGEPGIGKSTLLLQLAVQQDFKILYVTGEESESQVKMRAERIGVENQNCYLLTETSTQKILQQADEIQPDILIIDSIQTVHHEELESTPGSVSQIRESAGEFLQFAKQTGTPVFMIGHITKEGSLAGPKVLEHMVDTVLHFEGDRNHVYRLLRTVKNRFGSTNELGIYEMSGKGLNAVENPSEVMMGQSETGLSGTAVGASLEGMRPLLIEVQALVSTAAYGTPQRSATGFDLRRLNMLLAVLEKRCGFRLGTKDVFLNITGGFKISDPAIDLAVVAAIMSSNADIAISKSICLSAEIGLSGEIRPVQRVNERVKEAAKLGMQEIIISKFNTLESEPKSVKIHKVSKIEEVIKILFA
jgi:DNA repair protein RadA/Sms